MLAALVFALAGLVASERVRSVTSGLTGAVAVALLVIVIAHGSLPDVTPEATEAVCAKMMPGFGELMRKVSLEKVATAILSRQTAGRSSSTIAPRPTRRRRQSRGSARRAAKRRP